VWGWWYRYTFISPRHTMQMPSAPRSVLLANRYVAGWGRQSVRPLWSSQPATEPASLGCEALSLITTRVEVSAALGARSYTARNITCNQSCPYIRHSTRFNAGPRSITLTASARPINAVWFRMLQHLAWSARYGSALLSRSCSGSAIIPQRGAFLNLDVRNSS
jgi:hypothetical protein